MTARELAEEVDVGEVLEELVILVVLAVFPRVAGKLDNPNSYKSVFVKGAGKRLKYNHISYNFKSEIIVSKRNI